MIENVDTLGELIDNASETWPRNEAIVYHRERITYSDLRTRVDRLAVALLRIGVKKGDKISVLFTNRPQWAILEFAIDKIGAIVVPVNPRYSLRELKHILWHSDSTSIVMMEQSQTNDYIRMLKSLCPDLEKCVPGDLRCEQLPFLKNVIVSGQTNYRGTFSLEKLIDDETGSDLDLLRRLQSEVIGDDIAHLPYTSGTTGNPKGVMTTHRQYIRFNVGFIRGIGGFTEQDRLLVAPPFSHNFGNSQGILTPAFCGATSVLVENFSPKQCLRLVEE